MRLIHSPYVVNPDKVMQKGWLMKSLARPFPTLAFIAVNRLHNNIHVRKMLIRICNWSFGNLPLGKLHRCDQAGVCNALKGITYA
jgi:hypothetical protein